MNPVKLRDMEHLRWIYERMVHVHGENPNVDYMRRFAEIVPPIREPDDFVVRAHAAIHESCERWRRSLLVDGPTDHLHSSECTRVADLLREAAKPVKP
jgi:hypothetical protein